MDLTGEFLIENEKMSQIYLTISRQSEWPVSVKHLAVSLIRKRHGRDPRRIGSGTEVKGRRVKKKHVKLKIIVCTSLLTW